MRNVSECLECSQGDVYKGSECLINYWDNVGGFKLWSAHEEERRGKRRRGKNMERGEKERGEKKRGEKKNTLHGDRIHYLHMTAQGSYCGSPRGCHCMSTDIYRKSQLS